MITLDRKTFQTEGFETRVDPLTQEPFQVGDTVRLCVRCNTASLEDSWESIGSLCGCFGTSGKIDLRRRGQEQPRNAGNHIWFWVVGAIVVLIVLLQSLGNRPQASGPSAPTQTIESADGPAAAPSPTIPEESFYLSHWAYVRDDPSGSSASPETLARGTLVTGRIVNGSRDASARWLEITQGTHTGDYLSMVNLTSTAPPTIDTSTGGDYYLLEAASAASSPGGSDEVEQFGEGQKLTVVGSVGADGAYAEIAMKEGGVAYVSWRYFGGVRGSGSARTVYIVNKCDHLIRFTLSGKLNGQWQEKVTNGFWTFDASTRSRLALDNTPINIDDQEIYYYVLSNTDRSISYSSSDRVSIDGEIREMKRAVPRLIDDTSYEIAFCS